MPSKEKTAKYTRLYQIYVDNKIEENINNEHMKEKYQKSENIKITKIKSGKKEWKNTRMLLLEA